MRFYLAHRCRPPAGAKTFRNVSPPCAAHCYEIATCPITPTPTSPLPYLTPLTAPRLNSNLRRPLGFRETMCLRQIDGPGASPRTRIRPPSRLMALPAAVDLHRPPGVGGSGRLPLVFIVSLHHSIGAVCGQPAVNLPRLLTPSTVPSSSMKLDPPPRSRSMVN